MILATLTNEKGWYWKNQQTTNHMPCCLTCSHARSVTKAKDPLKDAWPILLTGGCSKHDPRIKDSAALSPVHASDLTLGSTTQRTASSSIIYYCAIIANPFLYVIIVGQQCGYPYCCRFLSFICSVASSTKFRVIRKPGIPLTNLWSYCSIIFYT